MFLPNFSPSIQNLLLHLYKKSRSKINPNFFLIKKKIQCIEKH